MPNARGTPWILSPLLLVLIAFPVWADYDYLSPEDSFVDNANATTNYGLLPNLYTGDLNGFSGHGKTRAYLKFDLSGIPAGSFIWEAQLWLYERNCSPYGVTKDVNILRTDPDWTETGINWGNAPPPQYVVDSVQDYCGTGGSTNFWATGDMATAFLDGECFYSLAVEMEEDAPDVWFDYYSDEWQVAADRPLMHVHWDLPPEPMGVCCLQDDSCMISTEGDCDAASGTWHSEWNCCNPNPCIVTDADACSWGRIKSIYR